jgi:hypothetical protein
MGPAGWITLAISGIIIAFNRMRDAANEAARAAQEALDFRNAAMQSAEIDQVRQALEQAQVSLARMRDIERDMARQRRATTQEFRNKLKQEEAAVAALSQRYIDLVTTRDTALTPDEPDAPGELGEARRGISGVQLPGLMGLGRAELDAARHAAFVQSLTQITTEGANAQAAAAIEAARMAQEALEQGARDTAENMTDAFAGFFEGMAQGFMGMMTLGEALKQGVTGLGAAIIEELTKGKAEYHMAEGAGALASGTWPPNPLALKAASQHFIAAGLFKALPGVVRSMGRPSSGGRMSIPSATAATRPSSIPDRQQPEINIYIDPLNPTNPAWQSNLAQTLRGVTQRYGSATVNVRPRTA